MNSRRAFLAFLISLCVPCRAQQARPASAQGGTVRVWGDPYMASVLLAWEDRFHAYHPEIIFHNSLLGTDTAMGALYGGVADLALLGRDSNQTEEDGFLHSLQYKPLKLRLMTGSLDTPNKSYAPVFFVHETNPLAHFTVEQAAKAIGYAPGPPVRTWGALGLTGPWKDKPLRVYTYDLETGTGQFLLNALQGPSKKMNWPVVREFRDIRRIDGSTYDAGEQILDALAKDPEGLAVSSLRFANSDVKPLALSRGIDAPFVEASAVTLVDRTYPLTRQTFAFINQAPGHAAPEAAAEFLRFVFSPEGQALIAAQPGFLPLSKADAKTQLLLLK